MRAKKIKGGKVKRKAIKNNQTEYLKAGVWYNPNTYNALDGALAYIIALVAFTLLPYILRPIVSAYIKAGGNLSAVLVFDVLASQGTILFIALAFSGLKRVSVLNGGGYTFRIEWVNILMATALILGVYFVFSSLHMEFVSNIGAAIELFGGSATTGTVLPDEILKNIPVLFLYVFVFTPLLPAICEEALFRGVIMRSLEGFGTFVAVIASGAMFSLMHGNYGQMILQFLGGVAMAWVVITTKNFLLGTVMHFVNNLFVSVIAVFYQVMGSFFPKFQYIMNSVTIIVGIVLLIASIWYFAKIALKNYKAKLLNESQIEYQTVGRYCLATVSRCEYTSEAKPQYEIQPLAESKDDERLFFYRNRFVPFNKKSNKKLSVILYVIGVVFAVILIFADVFNG